MAESDGLEKILNDVQGCSFDKNIFGAVVKVLDHDNNFKSQSIQKLLELCIKDPKDDVEYATEALSIISNVLRKVTAGEFKSKVDLLPSMLDLLRMLKTSIYSCSTDKLKVLYFKLLISYPDQVYVRLEDGNEVLELVNLYVHQRIPIELRVQPINVLYKYLKVLTPEKRLKLTEQGINTWLLKLIPIVMLLAKTPDLEMETPLAALEIIVDEFIYIDYYDNPNFQCILQCFYEPQKYPSILKSLLARGSDIWHRIWIVFIKILKNQLTKSGSSGSPINSMLPVVETAFKLDVTNRCRAFDCWNALIDNFASETNEAYVNKRMKLLVIPLYSNNAKVEETVIAKIKTWWHLICSYYSKLSNFAEIILIPFLQFCFGKPIDSSKSTQAPGMLTVKTRECCVEAFVNIFGHYNCDGCVSFPVLKSKVIAEKCLLASRKELVNAMNAAIKIVMNNPSELRQPYKCAWISLIKLICNVTDEDLRRDIFNEHLDMLENLVQKIQAEILADIITNDLIFTLFKEDNTMICLLNPMNIKHGPMQKVLLLLLNSSFDSLYDRSDMSKAVQNFKPFAEFFVKHCLNVDNINTILCQPLPSYNTLVLWTAITLYICAKKYDDNPEILLTMLCWPLKNLDLFTKVELSTSMWFALVKFVDIELAMSAINEEISESLNKSEKLNVDKSSFFLNVGIILVTQKLAAGEGIEYEKEVKLLLNISNKMYGLNHTHPVFTKLMETLIELFKKLLKDVNLDIAKQVLMILKKVFTILMSAFNKTSEINANLLEKTEKLLKSIDGLLTIEAYSSLKQIMVSECLEYVPCFGQHQSLKVTILATLQTILKSLDINDPSINSVKNLIASLKEASNQEHPIDKPAFTTPTTRKAKKKETSIVNTVVEDGEEFVVVKSNWKFNPKKLTENQKEKFKRKREDIPALYQDLSQSQDEFKLNTWKNDSQDTTNTNSKSNDLTTSEKVSSILKNMPNTDVVPKILKNILTENNEKNNLSLEVTKERNNEVQTPITKGSKPRLSLKDRVFRNVRILTEKIDDQTDEKHLNSVIDDVAPRPQTPPGMKIKMSEANSAPSDINIHRPSRVKRKPKKFEEMQIFAVKKRRNSLCNGETQSKDSFDDSSHSPVVTKNSEIGDLSANSGPTKLTDADKIVSDQDNQGNENIEAPNLADNISKQNEAETENTLNIDEDENVIKQQSSKSNVITTPSLSNIDTNAAVDKSIDALEDTAHTSNVHDDNIEDTSMKTVPIKKPGRRKSRIEKELAIDMVEGHPFLKVQPDKRLTRKKVSESPVVSRRKSLTQKLNKSKTEYNNTPKVNKKIKDINKVLNKSTELDAFSSSQEVTFQDDNGSQDVIESSQDSTISIMSAKSTKSVKRTPVIVLHNIEPKAIFAKSSHSDKSLSGDSKTENDSTTSNSRNNDDSDFPLNKTAVEHVDIDLTENFDTEPMESVGSNDIIVINDEDEPSNVNNLNGNCIEMDTQDIADADTQPVDSKSIVSLELESNTPTDETKSFDEDKLEENAVESVNDFDTSIMQTQEEATKSLTESVLDAIETQEDKSLSKLVSKDDEQRKQDFLNNTLEISPIKTLSPVRENKSPSPETSSDYVVIKLSSPVQSNGEPFTKCDSPEIFTEEKVSPDKRDQSPPREEIRVNTASPRSLSLKKNKPQVRSGGRAAQMLGLCIPGPDRLQTIMNSESKCAETEEPKKSSPLSSTARRNLRILYNSTNETSETSEESEESDNFLKMKRSLPAADSSPSVPILKRKLADITDETTVSPANKRKRVSFHDPPVSTTVCVKKYIEAGSIRSPQNSAAKRQERQLRSQAAGTFKSQKRLDTAFKLDTALTKAVESFSDAEPTANATEDTEMSSLEATPLVEVVKNSELNDVDPICLDLINCKDPVDNIAGELSSSAMRPLLVKEFAGKIETVGDLAKLTELEVNRLCIKAPKVQVAKKVLTEYAKKVSTIANEITPMTEAAFSESTVLEARAVDVEMQTDCVTITDVEVQTDTSSTSVAGSQTDAASTVDRDVQTDESGSKSTADIAKSLLEKPDFCGHLNDQLDVPSKQSVARSLPLDILTETVLQEIGVNSTSEIIDRLLEKHSSDSINGRNNNPRLLFMRKYLSERFSSKDLILLCSDLLKRVHDNSA